MHISMVSEFEHLNSLGITQCGNTLGQVTPFEIIRFW